MMKHKTNLHKTNSHKTKLSKKKTVDKEKTDMDVEVVNLKDEEIKELKEKVAKIEEEVTSKDLIIKEMNDYFETNSEVINRLEEDNDFQTRKAEMLQKQLENMTAEKEETARQTAKLLSAKLQYSMKCSHCGLLCKAGTDANNHKCGDHSLPQAEDIEMEEERADQVVLEGTTAGDKAKPASEVFNDDKEWNCDNCDYQGSLESALQNHMQEKHLYNCYTCKDSFGTFDQMMEHRRASHKVKVCRSLPGCKYGDKCWYRHPDNGSINDNPKGVQCNVCGNGFESHDTMMKHKRKDHLGSTEVCKYYLKGNCNRGSDCWFRHGQAATPGAGTDQDFPSLPTRTGQAATPGLVTDQDFPSLPTTGRGPVVGHRTMQQQMQQQLLAMMNSLMKMMN
jgi:hypothetical protein